MTNPELDGLRAATLRPVHYDALLRICRHLVALEYEGVAADSGRVAEHIDAAMAHARQLRRVWYAVAVLHAQGHNNQLPAAVRQCRAARELEIVSER